MKSLADVFAILSAYLTEPLLLLATDGTVLSANPAAGEWFPRAVSELPGQPLRDLVASPPGEVWTMSWIARATRRCRRRPWLRCDGAAASPSSV